MILKKITDDHYVMVDDSEIKEDCYALHEGPLGEREIVTANGQCKLDKKITHSTIPKGMMLMEGVKRLSLQEVKELIGEVDVEKKAETKYPKSEFWVGSNPSRLYDENAKDRRCFLEGYNQALEDNKEKKWTDEDVIRIVEKSRETGLTAEYLILLKQPITEWEVEFDEQGKLRLV